jgi:hypothetical protein
MKWTEWLQETRKMRFEEAFSGWQAGRLTQDEAARLLCMCGRTFRRYLSRYEESGLDGLLDKRLTQASNRRAPVDEVMDVLKMYRDKHNGWNVKHFYAWYRRSHNGGGRSYSWVKNALQSDGAVVKAAKKGAHRKRRDRSPLPGMMLHQDGSTHEWIPGQKWEEMSAANRYVADVYLPAFNAEFAQTAMEKGSSFVSWVGPELDDILCEQFERTVGNDNCVRFEGLTLQIPSDKHRCHYVKAKVRVHRYCDGRMAIFHGPRKLCVYDTQGKEIKGDKKAAA